MALAARFLVVCFCVLLVVVPSAPIGAVPTLLAGWNFNQASDDIADANPPIPSEQGPACGSITSNFGSLLYSPPGSDLNAYGSDIPGTALVFAGGNSNNGQWFQIEVDTRGYDSISITLAASVNSFGFSSWSVQTENCPNQFAEVLPLTLCNDNTYNLITFDLEDDQSLWNSASAKVRVVLDAASSSIGNSRIDNLQVLGIEAPSPSATPSTTASPSSTASPSASSSASPSATPSTSASPSSTASPSASSSASPSATPSTSASPSSTATPSASSSASPSATPSASASPSSTATPSGSASPSGSVSPSVSVSASASATPTTSPSVSTTRTPSRTPSASATTSTTPTASRTPTNSPTPTRSASRTPAASRTPTRTPTPTRSATRTPKATPSATRTPRFRNPRTGRSVPVVIDTPDTTA